MQHTRSVLTLLIGAALLLSACDKEPAPVGVDLLPEDDLVDIIRFDTQETGAQVRASSYFEPVRGINATLLWLGQFAEYESSIAMRWYNFTSPVGEKGEIVEARLTLYPAVNTFGESSGQVSFNIYQIISEWDEDRVTSDSLNTIATAPEIKGSFTGINTGDSIVVDLDTAMVRQWITKFTTNIDLPASEVVTEPFGMMIRPNGMNYVQAYNSADGLTMLPQLRVIIRDGEDLDTLFGTALRDTYLAKTQTIDETELTLQGGIGQRGKVWFDVSSIPPGSIVNQVRLYLHRDTLRDVRGNLGIDSVIVYESLNAEQDSISSSNLLAEAGDDPSIYFAQSSSSNRTITRAVQRWVNNPASNFGFTLIKLGETSDLDKIDFYDASADPALRPRLEVFYSTQP
ncbi:MAG: hypothetical protein CL946_06780 [Ectothiorhodospiraceae bacterium]|nr:hypothetical protein [Ectothiorhodospiraceae bacterium]